MAFLQRMKHHLGLVERAMGVLLVLTGLMFLTGTMTWIGQWMIETFPILTQIEGAFVSDDLQGKILGQ
jgi:cytochrome c-type biogenesis protein